jgi:MerC mercury resistance protein
MESLIPWLRGRLDRFGVLLSCLCLVHCLAGLVLVAGMGAGASFLLDPSIHKVGLLLATVIAASAIGIGAFRQRRIAPFAVALVGLCCMTGAVLVGHGFEEAALTMVGVVLVATGHILNLRKHQRAG